MSELIRKRGARWGIVGMLVLTLVGVWLVVTGADRRGGQSVFESVALPGAPKLPPLRGEEVAVVTAAPAVPAPITRNHATKVIVELETIEKTMRLADGVDYTFWTFNGVVPGSFIRVREGDLV